jgi:hypothetical protein
MRQYGNKRRRDKMKRLIAIGIALVLVLVAVLGVTGTFAGSEQIPATKAAAAMAGIYKTTDGWETLDDLTVQIKTGMPKDLIISVTAETALVTKVKLSGDTGSRALAQIDVKVLVDGNEVIIPGNENTQGGVVLDNRLLGIRGDLKHVDLVNPDHWLEIFLATKSAHGFNFMAENVGSGVHTVEVKARTWGRADWANGARYAAFIGNASVVVDEVNLK